MELNEILSVGLKSGASDIHLKAGLPPIYRIDGTLKKVKTANRAFLSSIVARVKIEAGLNIAEYHQARTTPGGDALAVVSLDGEPDAAVRSALLELPHVRSATLIRLGAWG